VLERLIELNLSPELITVLMSMIPVFELRASLPVAITIFNLPWYEAYYLSVIGNILPVPFLLLFFDGVSRIIQKNATGKRFIGWLLRLGNKRSDIVRSTNW
jgi:uncharacterized membrane protein